MLKSRVVIVRKSAVWTSQQKEAGIRQKTVRPARGNCRIMMNESWDDCTKSCGIECNLSDVSQAPGLRDVSRGSADLATFWIDEAGESRRTVMQLEAHC